MDVSRETLEKHMQITRTQTGWEAQYHGNKVVAETWVGAFRAMLERLMPVE